MDSREAPPQSADNATPERRWEHGSDFDWPSFEPAPPTPEPWRSAALWNSGREALCALIAHREWRRLWMPTYFCQDVMRAIQATGIETPVYADAPDEQTPQGSLPAGGPAEAVLVVNYFGLRPPPADAYRGTAEIVEDHTHDPSSGWARSSSADWCIASLRKSIPAPSGGALWSPAARPLPDPGEPQPLAERAASRKLAAMLLKRLFLDGHRTPKEAFRSLASAAEGSLGTGGLSAPPSWLPALLATFPVRRWRDRRLPNFRALAEALRGAPGLEVLAPADVADAPFCAFLVFADRRKAAEVRLGLIARHIYPARLWDLDRPSVSGIPARHVELAGRSLALHCDQRYGAADMQRVAEAVQELCR